MADLPAPTSEWPASIKYAAAPCSRSEAHTVFLRRPGGCNPTSAELMPTGESWYATCGDTTTWTIDWFSDFTCSVFNRTEFAPTPSACDLNAKGEYEREFCVGSTLPDDVDPRAGGANLFEAFGSLHSDDACSEAGFFMYIHQALGFCMERGKASSEMWVEENGALEILSYANSDCSGKPSASTGAIVQGACNPVGPSAWASLISLPEPHAALSSTAAFVALGLLRRSATRRTPRTRRLLKARQAACGEGPGAFNVASGALLPLPPHGAQKRLNLGECLVARFDRERDPKLQVPLAHGEQVQVRLDRHVYVVEPREVVDSLQS